MNKLIYGLLTAALLAEGSTWAMDPLEAAITSETIEMDQTTQRLHDLIDCRDEEAVPEIEALIRQGAKVNGAKPGGFTPLHHAAMDELPLICAALIGSGASVNALTEAHLTPLCYAASCNRPASCRVLISNGAYINHRDQQGYFPLFTAAQQGYPEVVLLLLDAGADVNIADKANNSTPLHEAANHKHAKIVTALLNHGANANACDSGGMLPLLLAAKSGSKEICESLIPLTIFVPKETKAETQGYKAIITALFFIKHCGLSRDLKNLLLKRLLTVELHEEFLLCSFKHLRRKLALSEACTALPDFMREALQLRLFDITMTTLHSSRNLTSLIDSPTLNELFAPAIRSNIARFLGAPEPKVTEVESTPELQETL